MKLVKVLKFSTAVAGTALAMSAHAAGTLSISYAFPNTTDATSPGMWPEWELTLDAPSGYFYGVTPHGGSGGGGAIFKSNTSGQVTNLHSFGASGDGNGSRPSGPLLDLSGTFWGVAEAGGAYAKGVLYKWSAAAGFQVVHSFGAGTDGQQPSGPLLKASDGNLYGTTKYGGSCSGGGTVYRVNPSTGVTTVLHSFCTTDGWEPITGVIQASDGNLYGTVNQAGPSGYGVLFRMALNGTFTLLYGFGATPDGPAYPGRLMQASDGNLYGTSVRGGYQAPIYNGPGTLFKSTLGGVVTWTSFQWASMGPPSVTAGLKERFTGLLYGVTTFNDYGDVFQYRISNATLSKVAAFSARSTMSPTAGLTLGADGNLWGSTTDGSYDTGGYYGHLYKITSLTANP
jgi:uncharacterized repeat protein (TIGR03803 family)